MKRIPLITSFLLFIVLCLSGTYWVMKLIKPEIRKFTVPPLSRPYADVESVASIFGGAMLVDVNYQLQGVVQANPMSQSVAIISIDGKPPKAYPIHSQITSGSSVNEVFSQYVLLSDHGVARRIELPKDAAPQQISPVRRGGGTRASPPINMGGRYDPDRSPQRTSRMPTSNSPYMGDPSSFIQDRSGR